MPTTREREKHNRTDQAAELNCLLILRRILYHCRSGEIVKRRLTMRARRPAVDHLIGAARTVTEYVRANRDHHRAAERV